MFHKRIYSIIIYIYTVRWLLIARISHMVRVFNFQETIYHDAAEESERKVLAIFEPTI